MDAQIIVMDIGNSVSLFEGYSITLLDNVPRIRIEAFPKRCQTFPRKIHVTQKLTFKESKFLGG